MATLSHFSSFFSLSSHKLFAYPLPSLNVDHHQHYHHRHPTICASSIKKPRAGRRVRSNADLCNDIREFIAVVGLPEGHVPSTKELSQHGRQDLANIVRRRGYKFIRELLSTSTSKDSNGSNIEEGSTEKQDTTSECGDESTGQDEKVKDLAEDVSLSSEVSIMENHLNNANGASTKHTLNSDDKSCMSLEASSNASLQERVVKFIQNGELDTIEEFESSSLGEDYTDQVLGRSDAAKMLSGSTLTFEQIVPPATESDTTKDDHFLSGGLLSAENNEDLDVEARKRENQVEINHLKFMLHQKELELSRLKEQIEKEKLALSILQTKAETEIGKAQKLISEKGAELHADEESLFGLEEVQIQYWGDGDSVEVAGSFNGWHHRIKMDPQPSSSIVDPTGSRKSRLWTTVLWLYPGIYEIKFIVDDHWRIDPQRESVTRGTIQNNILQVDR